MPLWRRLHIPVLWLLGEDDDQVPAVEVVAALEAAAMPNVTIELFATHGHGLITAFDRANDAAQLDRLIDFITAPASGK